MDSSNALSVLGTWTAVTTLYVTLTRSDNSVIGRGILTVSMKNFVNQLHTIDGIGGSLEIRENSAEEFISYFTERLAGSFVPFSGLQYPSPSEKPLRCDPAPTNIITVTASDGVESTLRIWVPRDSTASVPVLLVPGASVDYNIFALPTIPTNFVNYLLTHRYTVYCVDHRTCKVPTAKRNWTTYDSRLDIAAAVKYILKETGLAKIYAVVHCAGAIAMAAGLLDGTIQGIGGLSVSSVFMQPIFAEVNMCKALLQPSIASLLDAEVGDWYDCVPDDDDIVENLFNECLQIYPTGASDICSSVVCRRSQLVFGEYLYRFSNWLIGRLWSHICLNETTHENLNHFVGGVSMRNLKQLLHMGTQGYIINNSFESLLTDENIERLRNIPILFIHGTNNGVYSPESTLKDYDLLSDKLDASMYDRWLFDDHGHLDCWMGKSSFIDVYPKVEQHARTTITAMGSSLSP